MRTWLGFGSGHDIPQLLLECQGFQLGLRIVLGKENRARWRYNLERVHVGASVGPSKNDESKDEEDNEARLENTCDHACDDEKY